MDTTIVPILINKATTTKTKLRQLNELPKKYLKDLTYEHLWYAIFNDDVDLVIGFMEWSGHRIPIVPLHWNAAVKRCRTTAILQYFSYFEKCWSPQALPLAIKYNKIPFVRYLLVQKVWAKQEDVSLALYEGASLKVVTLLVKDLRKRFKPLLFGKNVKKALLWRIKHDPENAKELKKLFPQFYQSRS